jgi:hypothetical protein
MAIKLILFNTEMVMAILDGRKSCTRRLVKPQPDEKHTYPLGFVTDSTEKRDIGCFGFGIDEYGGSVQCAKPPYHIGDILYVRETWQYLYELDGNEQVIEDTGKYYYAATDTIPFNAYVDENGVEHDHAPWRPSIHMPKEAARIWLKVTNVRVERLQEITAEGIRNEGISSMAVHAGDMEIALKEWENLWNSTVKKSDLDRYGWKANPWVWVIEFERCEKPEGV